VRLKTLKAAHKFDRIFVLFLDCCMVNILHRYPCPELSNCHFFSKVIGTTDFRYVKSADKRNRTTCLSSKNYHFITRVFATLSVFINWFPLFSPCSRSIKSSNKVYVSFRCTDYIQNIHIIIGYNVPIWLTIFTSILFS